MKEIDKVAETLCTAINQKTCVQFDYESKSGNKPRKVQPYIVGIKEHGKGNIFLAALPIEELLQKIGDRKLRHYLLKDIDIEKLKVLTDEFIEPGVARKKIVDTPTIKVVCRFIYHDEDFEAVVEMWVKAEGLNL